MNRPGRLLASASLVSMLTLGLLGRAAAENDSTAMPLMFVPALHVFHRHSVEPDLMLEFYADILGFERIPYIGAIGRVQAGGSEFKLQQRDKDDVYLPGGPQAATGFRLVSFYFNDEAALMARFNEHNYPAPEFQTVPDSANRVALTTDPDGQPVELIVVPNASAETLAQIEIGLSVSDIEQSRTFYADFVGLEELPPTPDPLFNTTKYRFRQGSTLIALRSFGASLPADTSSGLIQYVVTNIDLIDAMATERGITIDRPLTAPIGARLRTLWISDPDGISNYFTETPESRAAYAP